MELLVRAAKQGVPPDAQALVSAIPYCVHLGILAHVREGGLILEMPFEPKLIGNVVIQALHGGVIGSLLEIAAIVQTVWEVKIASLPKPVDINIDYLRSGRAVTTYANARLARQGRRVVNVHSQLWQDDENKPIAALRGHFLLPS
ncbi:MAG TPA: PaaI family thioesterase [Rhizomicrobium sp.]|nr:PaaI family thioesterase [Rhizomicrobium sp.]